MAFTASQKPILAEILQVGPETLNDMLSDLTLTAEDESWIVDDLDLWEAKRNKIMVELEGGSDGVSFKTQRLLDAIRARIRKAFGLSLISFEVSGSSYTLPVHGVF